MYQSLPNAFLTVRKVYILTKHFTCIEDQSNLCAHENVFQIIDQ